MNIIQYTGKFFIVVLCALFSSAEVSANPLVITSVDAYRVDDNSGSGEDSADPDGFGDRITSMKSNLLVGFHSLDIVEDMSSVWVFKMTGVNKASDITNADFFVSQVSEGGQLQVDLHVVRVSNSSDQYIGDYEISDQLLMKNFSAEGIGGQSLHAAGQAALTTYLQNNWSDGEYLFIGIKNSSTSTGFTFSGRDGANFRKYSPGPNGAKLKLAVSQ